jgi:hypothetical protein
LAEGELAYTTDSTRLYVGCSGSFGPVLVGPVASGGVTSGLIASGQIGQFHLASGAVTSGAIASGQVGRFHLASGAVGSGAIASGSIGVNHFGSGAVGSGAIASGQIGDYHFASGVPSKLAGVSYSGYARRDTANNFTAGLNTYGSGGVQARIDGGDGTVSFVTDTSTYTTVPLTIRDGGVFSAAVGGAPVLQILDDGGDPNFFVTAGGYLETAYVAADLHLCSQINLNSFASGTALGSGAIASGQVIWSVIGSGAIRSGHIASGQIGQNHLASGMPNSLAGVSYSGYARRNAINQFTADNNYGSGDLVTTIAGLTGTVVMSGNWNSLAGAGLIVNDAGADGGEQGRLSVITVTDRGDDPRVRLTGGGEVFADYFNGDGSNIINLNANNFSAGTVKSGYIGSGQIGGFHLSSGSVTSGRIASGQIGQFHVASGAVTSGRIGATGTPDGTKFLRDDFTWNAPALSLTSGAATSGTVASGAVQGYYGATRHIASGTVGLFDLASGAVGSGAIASGSIGVNHLGSGAVGSGAIASGQVSRFHLSSGCIGGSINASRHILSGQIGGFDLAAGCIFSGQHAGAIIADVHILPGGIGSGSIGSGSISRFHHSSGSVQSGHVASGQIGAFHLASGSINSGHIGSGAVAGQGGAGAFHIASGTIGANDIGSGAIQSGHVASGQIGTNHVTSGALVTNARNVIDDSFATAEIVSGFRAVCLTQSGLIAIAQAGSGLRMPAVGVAINNYLSGATATVYMAGKIMATSGMAAGWSGKVGFPIYLGSGGKFVVSGQLTSGQNWQSMGYTISGGLYVNCGALLT